MTIKYYENIVQGSDEWFELRRGILTASEMKHIVTPTFKTADNEKTRTHLYELLAQRISGYVEPSYVSDDMMRGNEEEVLARIKYSEGFEVPVKDMGFITNDRWGFMLGYSPDGLVSEDGQIECKSRRQKYQVETILTNEMPVDYLLQVQTGLLVTGRAWCDFVSYSGGLPMLTKRIYPYKKIQDAIIVCY
ncbi:lambda exonuclease family protein [Larkinella sp. GY13]|uniref:lambda exonuclease family protein n=1 Tax=Larkinella sp. GY13 TaxID=3453720 RepID=UPI003EEE68E9